LTFLPGQTAAGSPTTLLIMNVNFVSGLWRINARGSRLVFESVKDVQWYDNLQRGLAVTQATGETAADSITVLKINQNVQSASRGFALGFSSVFDIAGIYVYPDGTPETRRSVITLDQSETGHPIAPDAISRIISDQQQNQYLFWANTANPPYDEPINNVIVYDTDTTRNSPLLIQASAPINSTQFTVTSGLAQLAVGMLISGPNITAGSAITAISTTGFTASLTTLGAVSGSIAVLPAVGTIAYQVASNTSYLYDGTFWTMTPTGWVQDTTSFRAAIGRGPNVAAAWITQSGSTQSTTLPIGDTLAFQWKHFAPSDHRINPATTNIIDIFVLTTAYDAAIRQWISNGAIVADEPSAPTELELSTAFSALETYKMFSDTIVWRPVTYKYLFGQSADPSVQAQFKVVRLANATVSDGQIQTQILAAINAFFAVAQWDFGETFYASELTAYVHLQLAGLISSFVLVPSAADAAFGDGYEISCNADEIMISTAQISDIVLISSNTASNLRIS